MSQSEINNPKSTIPPRTPRLPLENLRSPAALARFLLTTALVLAADLWSKAYAWQTMHISGPSDSDHPRRFVRSTEAYELLPDWLHFKLTINEGAVFGLGQGNRWLFVTVSMAAIAFLTYLFAASGRQRFTQVIHGLLLAGVLGNMYDRLRYGYVRDMIYALPGWQWPGAWQVPWLNYPGAPEREVFPWIFNVADMALCVGVGLLIAYSLFARENPEEEQDQSKGRGEAEPEPAGS